MNKFIFERLPRSCRPDRLKYYCLLLVFLKDHSIAWSKMHLQVTTSGVVVSVKQIFPKFRILGYLRDPRDWKTKATWYGEREVIDCHQKSVALFSKFRMLISLPLSSMQCIALPKRYYSHTISCKTRLVHDCKSTFLCKSSITDSQYCIVNIAC